MRRVLEGEQDLFAEREVEEPRDVVLGTSALLGIFLAVALVCAVCFGFGYAQGHTARAAAGAPAESKQRPAPRPLGGTGTAEEPSLGIAPEKPAPGLTQAEPPGEVPGMPPEATETVPVRRPSPSSLAAGEKRPALALQSEAQPMPDTAPSTPPAPPEAMPEPSPSPTLMVQIAAVSRAADAQTLASALRHDGFMAVVRTATSDSLFHVQLGPFASFAAAKAMRARLADNGYNAFLRP